MCILLVLCIAGAYIGNSAGNVIAYFNGVNTYLGKNHASIDISSNNTDNQFSILDEDIRRNTVILAGETHAVKDNFGLKLALIKYLNQKYDIKYLLEEMGYSSSCFINQYLESGDESKLKTDYFNFGGCASFSKESYNFWIDLRKYNLTVPENKRIKVIGIDIELQQDIAFKYLKEIIPSSDPPEGIQPAIKKFKKAINDNNNVAEVFKSIQSDIAANPDLYKSYLGNNYFDFSMIVDNTVNTINSHFLNNASSDMVRDPSMFNNFSKVYSYLPKGKYFGEFGMEHVYQKTCNSYMGNHERLAMYLNGSGSPVKGRVLSIAYGYENCYYMNWLSNYCQSECNPVIKDLNIINKYSKTNTTIFKLNGSNSPFNNKLYFVQGAKGGCTTEYFQYVILLKNSKGTSKLET